jgi:hypothetical protein
MVSLDLLGVELTDDQRAEIEEAEEEPEPELTPVPEDTSPLPETQPDISEQVRAELTKWKRKSLNRVKAGKSACVEFECEHVPQAQQDRIIDGLKLAKDAEDVRIVFTNSETPENGNSDTAEVLEFLKHAVDALPRLADT